MSYEEFKELLLRELPNRTPEQFEFCGCQELAKINSHHTKVSFRLKGASIGPSLSMESLYQTYGESEDPVSDIIAFVQELDVPEIGTSWQQEQFVRRHIFPVLVNTQCNAELLSGVLHRELLDLSIIYVVGVEQSNGGMASAYVTNELAALFSWNETQVYELSMKNLKDSIHPASVARITAMSEIIRIPAFSDPLMYVVTNQCGVYGAGVILNEDVREELCRRLGDEFLVLPSSIHELICIPADNSDVKVMAAMVYEINQTQVETPERLSNSIYLYKQGEGLSAIHLSDEPLF